MNSSKLKICNHEERHDSPRCCSVALLRSVTGYTGLDKIRSDVIRKEEEISGIKDVRFIYKQMWIS